MSWQAQTAVTKLSQQNKLVPFRLLCYLADAADEHGIIDPAPNQATMAAFLGCGERTVRNHLNTLIDSGELEQTRVGSGPGRPSAYRICIPLAEKVEKNEPKVEGKVEILAGKVANLETKVANLEDKVEGIAEKVEKIYQILATFGERLDAMVEKVERKGGKPLSSNGADDPYYDPINTPTPLPPSPNQEGEWGDSKTGQVLAHFVNKTGIQPPPEHHGQQWRAWIEDINTILSLCDDNVNQACELINRVISYMHTHGLTYSRPGSLVNVARRMSTAAPENSQEQADVEMRRKAEQAFDWLVRQGSRVGRHRYKDWGVTADIQQIMVKALGPNCIEKVTGVNPHQYQQDFVNEYLRNNGALAAQRPS